LIFLLLFYDFLLFFYDFLFYDFLLLFYDFILFLFYDNFLFNNFILFLATLRVAAVGFVDFIELHSLLLLLPFELGVDRGGTCFEQL
jgi:hypothetical protein